MRFRFLALACWLATWAASATAQGAATAQASTPLTLAEAQRLAESAHPTVRLREAQLAGAEGARAQAASPLANNPEFTAERARRRGPTLDGRTREWTLGVAQPIEIAGQQSRRREAAAATLEALRAEIEDARRQARAEASMRFHAVLAAQRRVQLEQRATELFDNTAQAVAKRRAAGEDTRLDANVAVIEAERARNALAAAREQLLDARSALALALQLPPATLPDAAGSLALAQDDRAGYDLDRLLEAARRLPRQRALAAREDAARARLDLERASRYPDVTVGLSFGREGASDARERVTMLSLSVPLPLFNRNDAAVGQASSEASQAAIERTIAERDTEAQVRRLWARLESQRERVLRLHQSITAAADDNQRLAARSRQAGQIGLLDQLLVNRQALDAERELGEALLEVHTTRIELEQAAGWPQEGSSR